MCTSLTQGPDAEGRHGTTLKSGRRVVRRPNMLLRALGYARSGLRVLPLHGDPRDESLEVRERCKRPLTPSGVHDATSDPAVIRRWWAKWPQANIGVVTDDLIVVDVDDVAAFANSGLQRSLPDTMRVKTGRRDGVHFWYVVPQGLRIHSRAFKSQGFDLKAGSNSYVVAPPSLHASGRRYDTACTCHVAIAPDWLLRLAVTASHPVLKDDGVGPAPTLGLAETAFSRLDADARRALDAVRPTRSHAVFRAVSMIYSRATDWDLQGVATAVWGSPAAEHYKSWDECVKDVQRIHTKIAYGEDDVRRYLDAVDADTSMSMTQQRLAYGIVRIAWERRQRTVRAGKHLLAIRAGVDPKTVFRHLSALEVKGLVIVAKEPTETSARLLALPIHTSFDREGSEPSSSRADLGLVFAVAAHEAFRAPQMRGQWREYVTRARENLLDPCEIAVLDDAAQRYGKAGRTEALEQERQARALQRRNARRTFRGLEEIGLPARIRERERLQQKHA